MPDKPIKPVLVSIVGPTAVGKTALAIALANELDTEIVSADSRQFYRELEIGTAKPRHQELSVVKHHFINSHSIKEQYSAGEYGRDAKELLSKLFAKKRIVIAVGGSTLYLKAIWEGFDSIPSVDPQIRVSLNQEFEANGLHPLLKELKAHDEEYFAEVDKNNWQRIIRALEVIRGTGNKFSSYRQSQKTDNFYENRKIGINMDRQELFDRINLRMDAMIDEGLFEEAERMLPYRNHNALQTVGYSEIFGFYDGLYDKNEAIRLLKRNSRRYAKRQLTWFNKYNDISWFSPNQKNEVLKTILGR